MEVITETNAEITECDMHFAEVGACPSEIHDSDSAAEIHRKKNIMEWFNRSRRSMSVDGPATVEVAVAYEYDADRLSVGCVQARPIRVMESLRSPEAVVQNRNGSPVAVPGTVLSASSESHTPFSSHVSLSDCLLIMR